MVARCAAQLGRTPFEQAMGHALGQFLAPVLWQGNAFGFGPCQCLLHKGGIHNS